MILCLKDLNLTYVLRNFGLKTLVSLHEYVEWIKDSVRRAHDRARKTLKASAKRQRRGYREPN